MLIKFNRIFVHENNKIVKSNDMKIYENLININIK